MPYPFRMADRGDRVPLDEGYAAVSAPVRQETELRHATTVAVAGRGLMIEGGSRTGKSALALEMLARGARLVADDATILRRGHGGVRLWAEAPATLPSRIEARGVGLLQAGLHGPVPLYALLTLDHEEASRLPVARACEILGRKVALFHRPQGGPVAAKFIQCMTAMASPIR